MTARGYVAAVDHELHHEGASKAGAFFGHLSNDFIFMGRFLVLGAAIAAMLQAFIPQSAIGSIAGTPGMDLVAMMGLAFLLSLCSESDAFVAASFVQFGSVHSSRSSSSSRWLDTKLGIPYSATFSRRFSRTVIVSVAAVTFAACLWIEVLFG